jgi:hypothetical protein
VRQTVLDVEAILAAWVPFKQALGVAWVRTADDYTKARAAGQALLEQIGDEQDHPLAGCSAVLRADRISRHQ